MKFAIWSAAAALVVIVTSTAQADEDFAVVNANGNLVRDDDATSARRVGAESTSCGLTIA